MVESATASLNATKQEIDRIFALQKANQYAVANTTARERKAKLKRLQHALEVTYIDAIKKASYDDFRKHEAEVETTELLPTIMAIKHALRYLKHWMRDEPVRTPIAFFGVSSKIKYEPKGVILIVSPWNFAFNLSFIPLVSAIAAGNTAIIKPSEMTPHSARLIKQIVADIFPENEVAVIEGGVPETTHLLEQPFNHIFFTGSPAVGKIVMAAAAKNLTSVSLELGGKSPTIVDESANVEQAAARIVWAKTMNNGQVCIAPDYVYVHESVKDRFLAAMRQHLKDAFTDNPQAEPSYNRIVNQRHFRRLQGHLEDAVKRGGTIEIGGTADETDNYIAPTVVSGLDDNALLWQEEIFGPILPLRTFRDLSEPIDFINQGEKPLACYIYSRKKSHIRRIEQETRSGGLVINYSTIHFINPHLPFGGSNNSGIGKGNGIHGFKAFSNAKAVQRFWSPVNALKLFWPPYTDAKVRLMATVRRWLS